MRAIVLAFVVLIAAVAAVGLWGEWAGTARAGTPVGAAPAAMMARMMTGAGQPAADSNWPMPGMMAAMMGGMMTDPTVQHHTPEQMAAMMAEIDEWPPTPEEMAAMMAKWGAPCLAAEERVP